MNRKAFGVTILLVWLSALGWLVRREYLAPRQSLLVNEPLNVSPGATYYRVSLGGIQIGFASTLVDTLADTVRVQDMMLLNVPRLDSVERFEVRTAANLSRSLELRGFTTSVRGRDARFAARGVAQDSLLAVDLESDLSRETVRVPIERAPVLPVVVPMRIAFGSSIAVGNIYEFTMFDPLLLEPSLAAIRVVRDSVFVLPDSADQPEGQLEWIPVRWDTVHAWRIVQEANGTTTEAWIDDLGQIVSATTPAGFVLERTAYEMAYENFGRGDSVPVLNASGAPVELHTSLVARVNPLAPRLRTLRVVFAGAGRSHFSLEGARQRLAGDTIIVDGETMAALSTQRYRLPNVNPSLAEYRAPSPLIQSRDPRIEARARQIIGSSRSAGGGARRLAEWVHEEMSPRPGVRAASAVDVLESLRGDASEYTVLFVALARAVGLPARPVAGLRYIDGRFYYHTWSEVYLDDWVAFDPMVGAQPIDASYLRLAVGTMARPLELLRRFGHPTLDVVEATPE